MSDFNTTISFDVFSVSLSFVDEGTLVVVKQYVDEQLTTKQDTLIAGENITIVGNVISSTSGGSVDHDDTLNKNSNPDFLHVTQSEKEDFIKTSEEFENMVANATGCTRDELVAARDAGELMSGASYRITDYITTSAQVNTSVGGHQFDVIVTAVSSSELSEIARACHHNGDTYFTNAKVEAWEIKYCIDNDTNRFAWADSVNGKGVIYYMKDEWGDECPYDFKNIQFVRKLTDGYLDEANGVSIYVYTFTWFDENNVVKDLSLIGNELTNDEGYKSGIFNNTIKETTSYSVSFERNTPLFVLGDNVFLYHHSFEGGLFYGCFNNSFGVNCRSNTFSDSCYSNVFGAACFSNVFGAVCYSNVFGDACYSNVFGDACYSNVFGAACFSNELGDFCYSNVFGAACFSNNFYDGLSGATKKKYIRYIVLEDGVQNNNFYSNVTTNDSSYLQRIKISGLDNATTTDTTIALSATNTKYEWIICYTSGGVLKQYCPNDLTNNQTYKIEDTSVSTWAASTAYAGYGYQAQINIADLSEADFVNVVFSLLDAISGNYAPAIEIYSGYILVFAKVNTTITIPTIEINKIDL